MSRFDRRLKGVNDKNKSITSGGSGAACVPQPIPSRGPLYQECCLVVQGQQRV